MWSRALPWLPVVALVLAASTLLGGPRLAESSGQNPRVVHAADEVGQGYLGSGACQSCHAGPYASWHDSYHRTMTRRADDLPFDEAGGPALPARLAGADDSHPSYELRRDGVRLLARGPDLHWLGAGLEKLERVRARGDALDTLAIERDLLRRAPIVERELVLGTGSHHYLALWVAGDPGSELRQLPWVWLFAERRWISRRQAFLAPPEESLYVPRWNSNCIQCHAVAGQPRETEGQRPSTWVRYETRVAELGIACEACHGPGKRHADTMRAPWRRQAARAQVATRDARVHDDPAEPPFDIVNPARIDSARSSAICGQCHSYFLVAHPEQWWTSGHTERAFPAVDLSDSRRLLSSESSKEAARAAFSRELSSIFWGDGSVRVGGREYNGLVESACYSRGQGARKLGCENCHSMHAYPRGAPVSQLRGDARGHGVADGACVECHAETEEHSRHSPGSPGSSCVGCHMPKTSYALLRAIPSHRISSPSRRLTDPPSACVLCHLGRTPAWLDEQLVRFYPALAAEPAQPGQPASESEPLGLRLLLSGDAATRALLANALTEPGSANEVDAALKRDLLERLTRDPYPAVRHIAARQLAGLVPAPPLDPVRARDLDEWSRQRDDRAVVISE